MVDLKEYRVSESEKARIGDLFRLIPDYGSTALDIGARDGYLSSILANRFESVTALDLEKPTIVHDRIRCVRGNICDLNFPDNSFEVVLCAEVLEHIPPSSLAKACSELARVAATALVIGVPYKQDIRVGRSLCVCCGARNPPWGHVNRFDEKKLNEFLSEKMIMDRHTFVGETRLVTNALSTTLMDYAGNPYGTYEQEEPCVVCGAKLAAPKRRSFSQRIATRAAVVIDCTQRFLTPPRPNWIHVRFIKMGAR